jgi:hypothetical protein
MTKITVLNYLMEFKKLRPIVESNECAFMEVALFIEDTFKIVLVESELTQKNLGSHDAIRHFLESKKILEDSCAGSVE